MDEARWEHFCALNRYRRAVRDFDGSAVEEADIRAVLEQALLAPSSGNLQPYELHWVRGAKKDLVAEACEAQRAARSAASLIVVVSSGRIAAATAAAQLAYVEGAPALDEKAREYHRAQIKKFRAFLRFGALICWAPFRALMAVLNPVYSLLPLGPSGVRNWTARSGIYAAQTLMLAASARGLDSCPMEGFDARRVARILGVPRGSVIPVVIAVGRRSIEGRMEPRWRRDFGDVVVEHRGR